ncbi:MAG: Gfo/Idh/MocA family oxidoreductase [Acidobacteria bacterium]|nr:Gfo/Idh/MocA family oxidoreductase [Acidobacteriota bacterium]
MSRNKTINIGIIGAGFARSTQIPGFRAAGARVVAITSAHREHAQAVASEFQIAHVADDWRGVIAREDVDLVSIATPPAIHMEIALAALDAGKAVLCEKPMAMSADEADLMRRSARETGHLALIDHELRFLAGRRRMREMLRGGEIGQVYHAKLLFRADWRAKPELAWDWWSSAEQGGGTLGAIGSHAVDAFRWLLATEATHVFCQLATHIRERPDRQTGEMRAVSTDDEANLLLRFKDTALTRGATGAISMSVVESGRPDHRLEIFGSRGALRLDGDDLWRSVTGAGQWEQVEVERGELAEGMRDSEWSRGFTIFARAITKALRVDATAIEDAATFEDGYRTQLVLDGAHRSHESGCWNEIV